MNKQAYIAKAKIIKSMAHPSRLMMIDALMKGELCVCELQKLIGSDISTISKHLSVMKEAGIVSDRKDGNKVIYSLRVPCVTSFFGCVEEVIRSNVEASIKLTSK